MVTCSGRRLRVCSAVLGLLLAEGCVAQDVFPPTLTEYFNSPTVPLNGSVMLDFSIANSNAGTMTGIGFTANLPAGLAVATAPSVVDTCGGTVTAVAGGSSISLAAGSLAQTTCDVAVSISGCAVGLQTVSPIQVNSSDGASNSAGASVTVVPPPTLTAEFGAPAFELGAATPLTFSIQNNSPTIALNGIAFSNTLPGGLQVATPGAVAGNCGGGIISAPSGAAQITFYGGSVAAAGFCSFSVEVTGIAVGDQNDTTSPIASAEGGNGSSAAGEINVSPASGPTQFCVGSATDLQAALSSAAGNSSVNEIRLQSGIYALASPLIYAPTNTKVTIVSGGWDPACSVQALNDQTTVLDAGGQHQVLGYVAPSVAGNLALQNLTIRNGVSAHNGGCLFVNTSGSFQLAKTGVETCVAGTAGYYAGGGLWVEHASSLLVSDATFSSNQAGSDGAAIAINQLHAGNVTVFDSVFDGNQSLAQYDGASAISVTDFSSPPVAAFTISGSVFKGGKGHAVNVGASVMSVINSAFFDNTDAQPPNTPQAECGYFAGVPRIQNPLIDGHLLIVDSTFLGSGTPNAGCLTANASGSAGAATDAVTVRNSTFSGFTAGVFPLNKAVAPPIPELQADSCDLRGNAFDGNTGGAAVVPNCTSLMVSHNKFLGNVGTAGSPGALYVNRGKGIVVDDNLFAGNQGNGNGGAVGLDLVIVPPSTTYPLPTGTYVFSNNTFTGNQANGYGGGISIQSQFGQNPTVQLWNNLFWSNSAGSGLGSDIYFNNDYLQTFNLTPITLFSNAYLASPAGYYVSIPAPPLGAGNVSANPYFINAAARDFRLAAGSPMIDAGNNQAPGLNAVDLAASPRFLGYKVDIGAFEYDADKIFQASFEETEF